MRGSPRVRSPGCVAALLVSSLLLVGCGHDETRSRFGSTRGYILVSIDTLRADHLGAYGYERDTSPFLDSLAEKGALFENAVVQFPGTLSSHMSIFTGLYPAEHDVYPPDAVLSPAIPTLSEVFLEHGYRTAGHTEGGYMDGGYGSARGFEDFGDDSRRLPDDMEITFQRGLDFLRGLDADEPFFLFLHTYAVHDAYEPPQRYRDLFHEGAPPEAFRPTGPNLAAFNRGELTLTPEGLEYFVSRRRMWLAPAPAG